MDSLLLAGAIVLSLVTAFAVARYVLRRRRSSHGEARQDVLKQSYHLHEKQKDVTLESLAGALHVTRDAVAGIVDELSLEGLLQAHGEKLRLTDAGTTAALKLIRSHRLWERYLADETGVVETKWHDEAEKQEHRLTPDDANALAKRLGHPMYDPHGDPIPQKDLGLPRPKGRSLASADVGGVYEVIHIEDEPGSVYRDLLSRGILRNSRIRVLGRDQTHAEVECDGNAFALSLTAAANVTVVPAGGQREPEPTGFSLGDLEPGAEARVVMLSPACRGMQRRRLLDLGVLPGTVIRAELKSPLGDPTGYRIRGSLVALRKNEADLVQVEAIEP